MASTEETASLEQETRHLWRMTCELIAAVDNNDREAVDEWKEAFEFFDLLAENAAIRKAANRNLHFILVLRPPPPPEPLPILSFVSGAAALLDAIARHQAEPPEVALPLAVTAV